MLVQSFLLKGLNYGSQNLGNMLFLDFGNMRSRKCVDDFLLHKTWLPLFSCFIRFGENQPVEGRKADSKLQKNRRRPCWNLLLRGEEACLSSCRYTVHLRAAVWYLASGLYPSILLVWYFVSYDVRAVHCRVSYLRIYSLRTIIYFVYGLLGF